MNFWEYACAVKKKFTKMCFPHSTVNSIQVRPTNVGNPLEVFDYGLCPCFGGIYVVFVGAAAFAHVPFAVAAEKPVNYFLVF